MADQTPGTTSQAIGASVTVEIWQIALNATASIIRNARNCLAPDSLARAESYRDPVIQRRNILAHAALHRLLAEKLQCEPQEITFQFGMQGKPALAATGGPRLHFNLSHSGELAVVALCEATEVGVDIEQIRPMRDPLALAKRFFTPREQTELAAMPPEIRHDCFFRLWTQKEALLKATGQGIANGLQRFEVTARVCSRLLSVDGVSEAAATWTTHQWSPMAGYQASAAIQLPGASFSVTQYPLPTS